MSEATITLPTQTIEYLIRCLESECVRLDQRCRELLRGYDRATLALEQVIQEAAKGGPLDAEWIIKTAKVGRGDS